MKIFCVGRNYAAHISELGNETPDNPVIFMKPRTALPVVGQPFYYPNFSKDIHYEGEIVLRVAKNGKCILPQFVHNYVDAYTLGFDFTARDIQQDLKSKGLPWELAKGFDGAAAIGEFLPLRIPLLKPLTFTIFKNGEMVQAGNTDYMIYSFEHLVCFISRYITLQKGDLIFTGTPAGVGRVEIGDILTGNAEGKLLITCPVK